MVSMEDESNRQYLIAGPLAAKKAEFVRQLGKIGSRGT
jgi:hypothetical protein